MRNRGSGKILVIIMAVVMVIVCSVAGVAVFTKKPHKVKGEKVPQGPTTMIAVGEFVVNLADTAQVRYLKTDIVIEVSGEVKENGGGEGGEGVDSNKTKLRDTVINVLSSKTFAELNKSSGKDELKKEIISAANKSLEGTKAVNVYFNEFAMQ